MIRKIETLDLEFIAWCNELMLAGVDPISVFRIQSQYSFIWNACRKRCADLCVQQGFVGMARSIMKNEDGKIPEDWLDELSDE